MRIKESNLSVTPPTNSNMSSVKKWMDVKLISNWGVADLSEVASPVDPNGVHFPRAIAWAVPLNTEIIASIRKGPNEDYAAEYTRVNTLINHQSEQLVSMLRSKGCRAMPLAASVRTDFVKITGEFPHKTAATLAGLGWIGRNCQIVTKDFGPWIRLGTVFTDMEIPCSQKVETSSCGGCTLCVEACPAKALTGEEWSPEKPRDEILDAAACDTWKKENYYQFCKGHNCGICFAVCPFGLKSLKSN